MNIKTNSHFGLAWEVAAGDLITAFPSGGEPVTFEVRALLPTNTNALVLMDTSLGLVQCLAGTPVEIFDGFEAE